MKARLWVPLLGVAVLALLAWGVLPGLLRRQSPGAAVEVAAVVVAPPRVGPIERTLRYSGTLKPKSTITVASKVPGRIEGLLAEEGQLVAKGALLARIEDEAARLQLQQAHAAWQAAQAQYEKARRGVRPEELANARALYDQAEKDLALAEESFRRSEQLYRSGAIAKAQYEQAESSVRGARTQLENAGRTVKMLQEGAGAEEQQMARSQAEAARVGYELSRLQMGYTRVEAPERGVVAKVLQEEGNTVPAGAPILVIVQDDPILAEAALPEQHYGELLRRWEEIEVRVRPAAYPEAEPFAGRVSAVSPTVRPQSRTFTVTAEIDNAQQLLRPGMYAEVELVMERRPAALLVPEVALLDRAGRKVLFVVAGRPEGGGPMAVQREVQPGLSASGEVEILDGLAPGERVVVQGNVFLEDGQPVRVLGSP
jgi:HlyD family secretion protein